MNDFPRTVLAGLCVIFSAAAAGAAEAPKQFRAGAATSNVTPPLGTSINGGMQDRPFVAMMSNGTSGGINNVNVRGEKKVLEPYRQIRLVAETVAAQALRAYQGIEFRDWVPLSVRQEEIAFGVRQPTADEVAQAREIVADAKTAPRMATREEIYACETAQMNDFPAQVPVILQAMRIGDLAITAIPCEVFVEIGLELKKKSPLKPTFIIELANGYNGYLPTPAQHRLGGDETWRAKSSYLEVGASEKITTKLLALLDQLVTPP